MESFYRESIIDGADIQQANLLFVNVEESEAQGCNNFPRRSASGKITMWISCVRHLTVNNYRSIGLRILRSMMVDHDNINSFLGSVGDFFNIRNTAIHSNDEGSAIGFMRINRFAGKPIGFVAGGNTPRCRNA